MKKTFTTLILLISALWSNAQEQEFDLKFDEAVPVLNMGTFHMGYSPDASTTEFDEHDKQNIQEVHRIAKAIAAFKPTIIVVECLPKNNQRLQESYKTYIENPYIDFPEPTEVELLAFEVGRLANTQRIYGIDFKEGYNYRIASQVENSRDSQTYFRYMEKLEELEKLYSEEEITIKEKLQWTNNPLYQDILININADMLTHVSSEGKAEGAEEASKFYHRNLVMYSNLNQIKVSGKDRIFILMGGTHTAFFNMWLKRSPKYKLEEVETYLK